jgi:hypothetical protein
MRFANWEAQGTRERYEPLVILREGIIKKRSED